jgi:hypothetical protein
MTDVSYSDLRRARTAVIKQSRLRAPGEGSMDTTTPMVRRGLEVVEFDVPDTQQFALEITSKNLFRISIAKKNYAIDLFAAALMSGLTYGSMVERRRRG